MGSEQFITALVALAAIGLLLAASTLILFWRANRRATAAESRVFAAEESLRQAGISTAEAGRRATEADDRAATAEQRERLAASRAETAEASAADARRRVQEASARVAEAETRAVGATRLADEADQRANEALEVAREATAQVHRVREAERRYGGIVDLEGAIQALRALHDDVEKEVLRLREERSTLRRDLDLLRDEAYFQEYGLYAPEYTFETAAEYRAELERIRDRQKTMVKAERAAVCGATWTIEGSEAKGRKNTKDLLKLMLRAFNGECDAIVASVRHDNVKAMKERVRKIFAAINAVGSTMRCELTTPYLELHVDELVLTYEYAAKVQQEREEQRRIRERMRDEEKALREIAKAQEDAEEEEARYERALAKAREEAENASGAKQAKLQAEIERLTALAAQAHDQKERAVSRAQQTRSGHVYVLSNIGSFGDHVYKVGMTRRLDPMERVQELGDASVPFPFDVHALIYSDDAPKLEHALHQLLDTYRVNRVNQRKEFFRATLDAIEQVVRTHHGTFELTLAAQAAEYRQTVALEKRVTPASVSNPRPGSSASYESRA